MDPTAKRIASDLRRARVSRVAVRPPGGAYRAHWVEAEGLGFDEQMTKLETSVEALERCGWSCRMAPGPVVLVESAQLRLSLSVQPSGRRLEWPKSGSHRNQEANSR